MITVAKRPCPARQRHDTFDDVFVEPMSKSHSATFASLPTRAATSSCVESSLVSRTFQFVSICTRDTADYCDLRNFHDLSTNQCSSIYRIPVYVPSASRDLPTGTGTYSYFRDAVILFSECYFIVRRFCKKKNTLNHLVSYRLTNIVLRCILCIPSHDKC